MKKRGAQKGNLNALKTGIYSEYLLKGLTAEQKKILQTLFREKDISKLELFSIRLLITKLFNPENSEDITRIASILFRYLKEIKETTATKEESSDFIDLLADITKKE